MAPVHPADVQVPTWHIFEARFLLTLPDSLVDQAEKQAKKNELLETIRKDAMSFFYKETCHKLKWSIDADLLKEMEEENAKSLEKLNKEIENAKEQYGDVELKDALLTRAHHYCRIGDFTSAINAYEEVLKEKAMESTGKVNIFLALMRIGLFTEDPKLTAESIDRAEKQFLVGGDWETRNRMRVYKALHLATNLRKFEEAANLLLSGLATFTANEVISFNQFVTITVLLTLCALPRPTLKERVSKSPEVLQVFAEDTVLRDFFQSFMACNYRTFFANYCDAMVKVNKNAFLRPHYRFFVRNMRLIAYRQYLQPYRSLSIPAMANAFAVSEKFVEDQLTSFIPSGKLNCRIDRVSKTIICDARNEGNAAYLQVVKTGDSLINNIQMLSRVIDM